MTQSQKTLNKPSPRLAEVPAGIRIYAVGDVHGRADLLFDVMQRIDEDSHRRPISHPIEVYLGDYIDRGPDSRQVLEILAHRLVHRQAVCLRGNHERLLEAFLHDPSVIDYWRRMGGSETLASYGVIDNQDDPRELQRALYAAMPRTHQLFLQCLRSTFTCGDYFFVHAGIRPGRPITRQTEEDLLWIRGEFLGSNDDYGVIVVHGHTPVSFPDVRDNRINIDTGAVWTGTLTCIALEGASLLVL